MITNGQDGIGWDWKPHFIAIFFVKSQALPTAASSNFEIQLLQRLRATLRFPALTKMVVVALAEQLTASQISLLGSGSGLSWITIYTSILDSPLFSFQSTDSASHRRSDLFVLSVSTFHGSSVGLKS